MSKCAINYTIKLINYALDLALAGNKTRGFRKVWPVIMKLLAIFFVDALLAQYRLEITCFKISEF